MHDDDEPVFKRSQWGTNRYYYNPRNPVGLALIVISLLFAATMMIFMANRAGPFTPPAPTPWPSSDTSWPPPLSTAPSPWPPPPAAGTPGP
ncbi:hypothetical protein ACIA6C_29745 [Streptomyces sp. NPDC051578]|uniref:hypothetical protein n=1 Tax=Streptomyces sp. NPDC051578 TaxID=3365662 RepID=UPI0037B79DCC